MTQPSGPGASSTSRAVGHLHRDAAAWSLVAQSPQCHRFRGTKPANSDNVTPLTLVRPLTTSQRKGPRYWKPDMGWAEGLSRRDAPGIEPSHTDLCCVSVEPRQLVLKTGNGNRRRFRSVSRSTRGRLSSKSTARLVDPTPILFCWRLRILIRSPPDPTSQPCISTDGRRLGGRFRVNSIAWNSNIDCIARMESTTMSEGTTAGTQAKNGSQNAA